MYLLDTNVVSELRKGTRAAANVRAWADKTPAGLYRLSIITLLELEIGVLRMERRDTAQGAVLRKWLEEWVLVFFNGHRIDMDLAVARRCAALHVPDPRAERDAMIAATALVHGLTVVTHNTADFESLGVALLNPWLAPST
jgi:toxin FitB